ncbi:MAG: hypothetical protein ACREN6_05250 [Gemmatimonadaceae bacterium]
MKRNLLLAILIALMTGSGSAISAQQPARASRDNSCTATAYGIPMCDEGMVDGWMSCAYAFQSRLCPPLKTP